jgi:hypothetical protein
VPGVLAVIALTACGSAAEDGPAVAATVAATPCRGGHVARTADQAADVVDDLRPERRPAFPVGLDLRAAAVVVGARRLCATWRLAAAPPRGTLLGVLLYRARDGGGGVAVEIDARLTDTGAEVAAGGYGDDQDEFHALRAYVRRRGDQVTAVVASRQLPGWTPRPADLVWAVTTRDIVHGLPLTDRAPSQPAIGVDYLTGRPCNAGALRCD